MNARTADERKLGVLLGAPGSGKSALITELIGQYNGPVVIVDPSRQWIGRHPGAWYGEKGEADADVPALLSRLRARGFRGLLVLDDADQYLGSSTPKNPEYKGLFAAFRHFGRTSADDKTCGVDVILSTRRTQDIPKIAVANASWLAIFRMRSPEARKYIASISDAAADGVKMAPKKAFEYVWVDVDGVDKQGRSIPPRRGKTVPMR